LFTVNRNPSRSEVLKFGRAMVIGFGVLGLAAWLLAWWRSDGQALLAWHGTGGQKLAVVLWALGVVLCAVAYASPNVGRRVYVAWMSVAVPIGIAMSMVLLSVLFFLLLPVFSIIVRIGDPLRRRLRAEGSYWEEYRPYPPTLERMRRPF